MSTSSPHRTKKSSNGKNSNSLPLSQAIEGFELICEARRLSPATIRNYFTTLYRFQKYITGTSCADPMVDTLDGTEKLLVLADPNGEAAMKTATTQQIADLAGGGSAPRPRFIASFHQEAENDPVLTVFFNDIFESVTAQRIGVGQYRILYTFLEREFVDNLLPVLRPTANDPAYFTVAVDSSNFILNSFSLVPLGVGADNLFYHVPLLVYGAMNAV